MASHRKGIFDECGKHSGNVRSSSSKATRSTGGYSHAAPDPVWETQEFPREEREYRTETASTFARPHREQSGKLPAIGEMRDCFVQSEKFKKNKHLQAENVWNTFLNPRLLGAYHDRRPILIPLQADYTKSASNCFPAPISSLTVNTDWMLPSCKTTR
jgi:hypothetical protein